MERRYELRLEQMLAQAEVSPESMQRPPDAARSLRRAVRSVAHRGRAAAARRRVHDRPALQARAQDGRGDRLPPRPGAPGPAEVRRARALGPPAVARDPGPPGRRGPRRARRRDRLRPLGVRQEGDQVGRAWRGSGAAGSARSRTARSASSWPTSRGRDMRSSIRVSISPRNGRRTAPAARRRACPRRSSSAPATQLALEMLDECGEALPHAWVAGDDEMGRPSGFRRELRGRGERYLLARPVEHAGPRPGRRRRRSTRGAGAIPRARSRGWTAGVRRCRRRPGPRSTVRDGEKGPLVIEVVKRRVQARTDDGGHGPGGVAVRDAGAASGRHVQA